MSKKISSALISVFDKDGLEPIVRRMHELGIVMYSTGGTQDFIEKLNLPVIAVEELTGYPSILGGRVKTLHPKIFGGILNRRDDSGDQTQVAEFEIPNIDCVVVDLYPFEKTVASGASHDDIIEKIDIGGISLIRGAAKNYSDVVIVASKAQYADLLDILENQNGTSSIDQRRQLAREAFQVSSHYDTKIYQYFLGEETGALKITEPQKQVLRYGENPHQKGIFYGDMDALFEKLNGKEISYNNLLDVDAAVNLIDEFKHEPATFAILKHNNACGIATRSNMTEAYEAALACDPVSAFGGVLIANGKMDLATAEKINSLFCEVIIAPEFDAQALELLKSKANRILLRRKDIALPKTQVRTLLNGYLFQDKDLATEKIPDFKIATTKAASDAQLSDLEFANKIVKHTKSNTVVLAKNKQLCASGTGQTSRVDALKQAIEKAQSFQFDLHDAVMASDAFFPFPDCVEIAHHAGITAVVQPGGSIKDQLSIDYCNSHQVAMYLTGTRHFRH
ncbi:MAG: bifunctional phosphoribosylaminoimidazolecarboxamide formyltransferase/IMP cyclohydrolase [Flavobacteriales bacterium]|nr:bifunctional phosphoribosylaminoimidazolecarboxamide formyltransferase/IMP cyclohydrolase [Flavobacteriales bacterium]